jgi:hypothetical protein
MWPLEDKKGEKTGYSLQIKHLEPCRPAFLNLTDIEVFQEKNAPITLLLIKILYS